MFDEKKIFDDQLPDSFNPTREGFFVSTADDGRPNNNKGQIFFEVP